MNVMFVANKFLSLSLSLCGLHHWSPGNVPNQSYCHRVPGCRREFWPSVHAAVTNKWCVWGNKASEPPV